MRCVCYGDVLVLLDLAGLETPDISILADGFRAEIEGMERKNLAMEALRKVINGKMR